MYKKEEKKIKKKKKRKDEKETWYKGRAEAPWGAEGSASSKIPLRFGDTSAHPFRFLPNPAMMAPQGPTSGRAAQPHSRHSTGPMGPHCPHGTHTHSRPITCWHPVLPPLRERFWLRKCYLGKIYWEMPFLTTGFFAF